MVDLDIGASSELETNKIRFEFRGNAKDYFGIWIVNLFFSIVTLGIYTAWAKVRRQRYFYGNTFLDDHNFEYHAKPKQILIGRIIVVAVLVIYQVLVNIHPGFGVLIIVYLAFFPWILNKALSFNARVTSYRNVRFNFNGSYWRALLAFIVMPIIAVFSLGLLLPYSSRMSRGYIGNNLSWGHADFKTDMPLTPLYKVLGICFLIFVAIILVLTALFFVLEPVISGVDINGLITDWGKQLSDFAGIAFGSILLAGLILVSLLPYLPLVLAYIIYSVTVRNVAYNATMLVTKSEDGACVNHQMSSNVSSLKYFWILVSNLIAVLFTVGLLRAWAAVRSWRYLVEHTAIAPTGTLDNIVSMQVATGDAVSAEFFDIEGIDFGL